MKLQDELDAKMELDQHDEAHHVYRLIAALLHASYLRVLFVLLPCQKYDYTETINVFDE